MLLLGREFISESSAVIDFATNQLCEVFEIGFHVFDFVVVREYCFGH